MGIMEENTLRKFMYAYPARDCYVEKQTYIGELETVFEMSNGSRILYDESEETFRYLKPRDNESSCLTDEEWRNEFSRKLKKKLAFKGLTQKDLASAIGVNDSTISRYINNKQSPDGPVIYKIAKFLRCPMTELMDFNYLL